MNKFLLGVGAALLIAAGGISLASAVNASPKSPTLRVKYELFGVEQTSVKEDVEKLTPLQSNTVVFTPNANGSYTAAPGVKYWLSQPSYSLDGQTKYADVKYGIKFTLVPQKWNTHQTYVVNLSGVVGDGAFHGKDEDIALAVTLNPGEQSTLLTKMFKLKTTIEEVNNP